MADPSLDDIIAILMKKVSNLKKPTGNTADDSDIPAEELKKIEELIKIHEKHYEKEDKRNKKVDTVLDSLKGYLRYESNNDKINSYDMRRRSKYEKESLSQFRDMALLLKRQEEDRKKSVGIDDIVKGIGTNTLAADLVPHEQLSKGMDVFDRGSPDSPVKFIQDARAAANEITGLTAESGGLLRSFEKIGKSSYLTGKDRASFEREYLKNLKTGIKSSERAEKLSVLQLSTATQIGVEADNLGVSFTDMANEIRMSDAELANVGRGIRDVAKFTGITGANLTVAVGQAQELTKSFNKAAISSSTLTNNVTQIVANAKKLGVEGVAGEIIESTKGLATLIDDSNKGSSLLVKIAANASGRMQELQDGTILKTKQGVKDLKKGLADTFQRASGITIDQIDKINDTQKARINAVIKGAFGIEINQFKGILESFEDAGKTLQDRLNDANKKMKGTEDERKAAVQEISALKTSASLEILSKLEASLVTASKAAKTTDDAITEFGKKSNEFNDDLRSLGVQAGNSKQVIVQTFQEALKNINQQLKTTGQTTLEITEKEMKKALENPDPVAFRNLTEKLTKAQQAAAVATKTSLDPVTRANQILVESNDALKTAVTSLTSSILDVLQPELLIIAAIMSKFGGSLISFEALGKMGGGAGGLGDLFKGKNKGGSGSAGGQTSGGNGPNYYTEDLTEKARKKVPKPGAGQANVPSGPASPKVLEQATKTLNDYASQIPKAGFALGKLVLGVGVIATAFVAIGGVLTGVNAALGLDPIEIAKDVSLLLAGAVAIGAEVVVAAYGLKVFEKNRNMLLGSTKDMAVGGAVLLGLTAGVGALALGILGLGSIITWGGSISPDYIAKITESLLTLIGGAAAIGGAVILSAAVLGGLGAVFITSSQFIIPAMLVGAAALVALTPAIAYLSMAIIDMSSTILAQTKLTPETIESTVGGLTAIIGGAASISWSVLNASAALIALSPFYLGISLISNAMYYGAEALNQLTPLVGDLSNSILKMADNVVKSSVPDIDKTVKGLDAIISGAEHISWEVMKASVGLSLMNGLWPLIPLIGWGGLAIRALTPAISGLSQNIIYLAEESINPDLDAETIKETVTSLDMVISGAESIASSVVGMSEKLALIAVQSLVMIPSIWLGGGALQSATPAIINLSKSVVEMASSLEGEGFTEAYVKDTVATLDALFDGTKKIATSVLSARENLNKAGLSKNTVAGFISSLTAFGANDVKYAINKNVEIVTAVQEGLAGKNINIGEATKMAEDMNDLFLSTFTLISTSQDTFNKIAEFSDRPFIIFGSNVYDKINLASENAPKIAEGLKSLVNISNVVLDSVKGVRLDKKTAELVGQKVKLISDTTSLISNDLVGFSDNIVKATAKGSGGMFGSSAGAITKLVNGVKVDDLKVSFTKISALITEGVIDPVVKGFGKEDSLKNLVYVKNVLTAFAPLVGAVSDSISALNGKLYPLIQSTTKEGIPQTELGNAKIALNKFGQSSAEIFTAINASIIKPILGLKINPGTVIGVSKIVVGMTDILNAVPTLIESITVKIADISKFKGGRVKKRDIDVAKKTIEGFGESFPEIVNSIDENVVKPLMTNVVDLRSLNYAAKVTKNLSELIPAVVSLIASTSKDLPVLSEGFSNIKITMGSMGDAYAFADLMEFIGDDVIDPIFDFVGSPKDVAFATKSISELPKLFEEIQKMAFDLGQVNFVELNKSVASLGGDLNVDGFMALSDLATATVGFAGDISSITTSYKDVQTDLAYLATSNPIQLAVIGNLGKYLNSIKVVKIDKFADELSSFASSMGIISEAYYEISSAVAGIEGIGKFENLNVLKNISDGLLFQEINPLTEAAMAIESFSIDMTKIAESYKSIYESFIDITDLSGKMLDDIEIMNGFSGSLNSTNNEIKVNPDIKSNSDVMNAIDFDRSSTEAPSTNIESAELEEIAGSAQETNALLQQQNELLNKLIAILSSGGSGGSTSNSSPTSIDVGTPSSSKKLTTGLFSQSATKNSGGFNNPV